MHDDDSSRGPRPGWPRTPTRRPATSSPSSSTPGTSPSSPPASRGTLQFGTAGPARRARRRADAHEPRRSSSAPPPASPRTSKAHGRTDGGLVVIGYDARHKSADFARDTAAVMAGAGLRAAVLPRPLPTPVLAFAIRHLGAVAGVEVTASHNPPRDNGYKVYLGDGSQIVPPGRRGDRGRDRRRRRPGRRAAPGRPAGRSSATSVLDAYLARTDAVLAPDSPRTARTVYTAMHGVGKDVLLAAFARAGFPEPVLVAEQAEPDPDFPTVAFPNPEEPGAMDLAFAHGAREPARTSSSPTTRTPTAAPSPCRTPAPGRLADAARRRGRRAARRPPGGHAARTGTFAESIVSSSLLGRIAEKAGLPLRGDADRLQVDRPRRGPALRLRGGARLLRGPGRRARQGRHHGRPADRRTGLRAQGAGPHPRSTCSTTSPSSTGCTPPTSCRSGSRTCRSSPPRCGGCASSPPTALAGLRRHLGRGPHRRARTRCRPPTACATTSTGARVIVRPSGTEPKLKCYLEVVVPVAAHAGLPAARAQGDGPAGRDQAGPVGGGRHLSRRAAGEPAKRRRRATPSGDFTQAQVDAGCHVSSRPAGKPWWTGRSAPRRASLERAAVVLGPHAGRPPERPPRHTAPLRHHPASHRAGRRPRRTRLAPAPRRALRSPAPRGPRACSPMSPYAPWVSLVLGVWAHRRHDGRLADPGDPVGRRLVSAASPTTATPMSLDARSRRRRTWCSSRCTRCWTRPSRRSPPAPVPVPAWSSPSLASLVAAWGDLRRRRPAVRPPRGHPADRPVGRASRSAWCSGWATRSPCSRRARPGRCTRCSPGAGSPRPGSARSWRG